MISMNYITKLLNLTMPKPVTNASICYIKPKLQYIQFFREKIAETIGQQWLLNTELHKQFHKIEI